MRRRAQHHHLDIFVVFSDISLSLAFILLVYAFYTGLSATKTVVEATRTVRQQQVRDIIVSAWQKELPIEISDMPLGEGAKAPPHVPHPPSKEEPNWYVFRSGSIGLGPLAIIRLNASYLRVSVYAPQFAKDSRLMSEGIGKTLLVDAARVAADRYGNDLDYLEVHGLSRDPIQGLSISRERALNFAATLQQIGLVSTGPDKPAVIPLRFLECYGTGNLLYAEENPDRVDLRLFFTDAGKGEAKP